MKTLNFIKVFIQSADTKSLKNFLLYFIPNRIMFDLMPTFIHA